MLRVKGFAAVAGKPMRLLVQAVGPRVSHYYDRPWARGRDARRASLVVIGLKGLDRDGDRKSLCSGRAMHLLQTSSATLDDIVEPVDLGQTPGDIVVLSFADSDLAGLAAAYAAEQDCASERAARASARSAPSDVGRSLDRQRARATPRSIVVRLLGGLDWWRYGVEALGAWRASADIALAVLPGEDRDDPRLAEASTLPPEELAALLALSSARAGARICARCSAGSPAMPARRCDAPSRSRVPRMAGYLPGEGAVTLDALAAALAPGRPVVPIIFYRAALLAADTAPIDALCEALAARGLAPAPLVVPSLKDPEARDFVRGALRRLAPAVIVTTTAFAAGGEGEASPLDATDVPVLQAVIATTRRAAWRESPRGLGAADLAMHVVLPELDGRVLAGAIAFKDALPKDDALGFTAFASRPEPDRIAHGRRPHRGARCGCERRRAASGASRVLMPDYPGARRPHRLCRRPRRAGERRRAARRPRRSGLRR